MGGLTTVHLGRYTEGEARYILKRVEDPLTMEAMVCIAVLAWLNAELTIRTGGQLDQV